MCATAPAALHGPTSIVEHAVTLAIFGSLMVFFARLIGSSGLLALAGCATLTTAEGERLTLTSDEFRAYVERVFREQNRVADELAFALEVPGGERAELSMTEQQLLDACAGVNELATARRDEQRLGVRRSVRAAHTLPRCERTTRDVAALLARSREP